MTATSAQPAERFLDIVKGSLGPRFRERAPAQDASGHFVADNYRELAEHRFFSAAVPAELGGGGVSHRGIAEVLRELAHYCPSTALAFSMHTHLVAAAVWRHRHGQPSEALLRKVAAGELCLVSTGAGDWVDSVGRAERVPGGYRVSALKRFCSGAPAGSLLVTSAPHDDEARGPEVLHFAVPLAAEGVVVKNDWDTLGMRATGSHSIELKEVFVPEEAIVLRRPRGEWHGVWNVVLTVAAPLYMAPYVGVAERAAEVARLAVRERAPEPALLVGLGELENQVTLAQLAWRSMLDIADDYAPTPTLADANRTLVRKTLTANAARAAVLAALETTGGGALFRRMELERLFRDAQGAPFHPLPENKQLVFTGRVALGLSPIG